MNMKTIVAHIVLFLLEVIFSFLRLREGRCSEWQGLLAKLRNLKI